MNTVLKPLNVMTKGAEQNIRRLTQRPNIPGRIKESMEKFPLFLFTVPLFIVIHMEQEYNKIIVYHFVYEEIIQLFLTPFIILCVCLLFYRHLRKALMATFILMIPFYFFSDYKDAAEEYFGQSLLTRYSVMIPLLVIAIGFLLLKIMRTKRRFRQAFFFINTLFSLFIIADLVVLLFFSSITHRTSLDPKGLEKQYEPCNDCIQPDIYHIVFDAYTSSSALKSVFGYDNGQLDQFLLSKGFFIATESKSNYNLTAFSLSSTFNMQYFKGLDTTRKLLIKQFLPGVYGMYETALQKILITQGYRIVNNSIFRMNHFPPEVQSPDIWGYQSLYERHNIFKRFDMDIGWSIRAMLGVGPRKDDFAYRRDEHVKSVYHTLLNLVEMNFKKPKFVYSHFMLPHDPYTFDSAGKKITVNHALILEEEKKRYADQLIYTNKLITHLIDQILKKNPRPVVIVLQGDHGLRFHDASMKDQEFPNLHAVYFFNGDYRFLKQSMSPVNTYRAVLNTLFKQKYPLIEDKSYYLKYY